MFGTGSSTRERASETPHGSEDNKQRGALLGARRRADLALSLTEKEGSGFCALTGSQSWSQALFLQGSIRRNGSQVWNGALQRARVPEGFILESRKPVSEDSAMSWGLFPPN